MQMNVKKFFCIFLEAFLYFKVISQIFNVENSILTADLNYQKY